MKQLVWALIAALGVCACGGTETGADGGGRDGQVVPDMDAGDPVSVCAAADDCDDGDYCNGVETCAPGEDGAGADGCIPGTGPCADGESCDEDANQCISADCTEPDADMDGHDRIGCGSGDDCDDNDANRYPGNPEICDTEGHDEDCNPETITDNPDADGDTHIDDACFNLRDDGTENRGRDCNDARNTVNPDAAESCNGVDDDCDGMIDEGVLTTFYQDVDGDNAGNDEVTTLGCTADAGYVLDGGDCDDTDREINPSASESCNGIDDNCDGMTDPGCECTTEPPRPCGPPEAGTGSCQAGTQACVDGAWETACSGAVYPSSETCNAGDEDCDGLTNDDDPDIAAGGASVGGGVFFQDDDGDLFGTSTTRRWCVAPVGWVNQTGDCDDDAFAVNPNAVELCNGIDDNCDGFVDNRTGGCECVNMDTRPCGTDIGACVVGTETCMGGTWVNCTATGPHAESCDGIDTDCDGTLDPSTCECTNGDTRPCGTETGVCVVGTQTCNGGGWSACLGGVSPGDETCDELDNDCDGSVDETLQHQFWQDGDSDGYGNPAVSQMACTAPTGYVDNDLDCNDSNEHAAPDKIEASYPCDGVDNDCDMHIDEVGTNQINCYRDRDGDTYGTEERIAACACPSGWVSRSGDCDDTGARAHLIHPGAGYQVIPHCSGEVSVCTNGNTGRPGCTVCTGGDFPVCLCLADAGFDYDCDSVVETVPGVSCGPNPPVICGGNGGPLSPDAADCGTRVTSYECGLIDQGGGVLQCGADPSGTVIVGCR